jgi:hypothetical protein
MTTPRIRPDSAPPVLKDGVNAEQLRLVAPGMSQIAVKISNITTAISSFKSEVTFVAANFTIAGSNLETVGPQLFTRCTLPKILVILANIATPVSNVAAQIAPIGTNFPCVDSDLAPISAQFSSLLRIDVTSLTFLSHRGAHTTKHCDHKHQTSTQIFHYFSPPYSKVKGQWFWPTRFRNPEERHLYEPKLHYGFAE